MTLTFALAQINPTVGDVPGNVARILDARGQAAGADLVIYPELSVSGYPPEDLVLKDAFLDKVKEAVLRLAAQTADNGPALLVGAPWKIGGMRHNAALLLDGGAVAAVILKSHLPNYGVFDEARVFRAGPLPKAVAFRGVKLGIMVCEDMWYADVAQSLKQDGADILVVPNGSPFETDKENARLHHATQRVVETGLPLIYVNQMSGQDELVFDGASFVLDTAGRKVCALPSWQEKIELTRWSAGPQGWTCAAAALARPVDGL